MVLMKTAFATLLLTAGCFAMSAQVGQDIKAAGHDTKDAATTATRKTKNGTKRAYHKSTHAVKKGAHKTATKVSNSTSDTGTR